MRAAVVYYGDRHEVLLKNLSEAFCRGLESQGFKVDVINAAELKSRLAVYKFIAFCTEPFGPFGGKLPDGFVDFIKKSGTMISTRAFAFVPKKGFNPEKSLLRLMSVIENEGLFVVSSEVFSTRSEAEESGKKINVRSGL